MKKDSSFKISIIVPVYNVEKYIHECVNSILKQTYQNYELILVDDGSTDQCVQICDEYQRKDGRVRVIHKKNGGLSDARNFGIEVATGDYISFVDSDDIISQNYIEIMLSAVLKYDADIVQGTLTREQSELNAVSNQNVETFTGEEAYRQCMLWKRVKVYACAKLYRKELFQDIRYPLGRINEDSCTFYKIFPLAKKVVCVPDYIYFYRKTPGSIMNQPISKKRLEVMNVPNEMQEYFGENSLKYRDEIEYYRMRLGIHLYNESITNGMADNIEYEVGQLLEMLKSIDVSNPFFDRKYKMLLFILKKYPRLYEWCLLHFRKG